MSFSLALLLYSNDELINSFYRVYGNPPYEYNTRAFVKIILFKVFATGFSSGVYGADNSTRIPAGATYLPNSVG